MIPNYSFFHIKSCCLAINSSKDLKVKRYNKIWEWTKGEKKYSYDTYNLRWIDLISSDQDEFYGQTYDVEIWCVNKINYLVFTNSYSVLSLVRQFIKDEFDLDTNLTNFSPYKIAELAKKENVFIQQAHVLDGASILNTTVDYVFSQNGIKEIFFIDIIIQIQNKSISLQLFSYGLIKLTYGSDKFDVLRLCDEFEIIK